MNDTIRAAREGISAEDGNAPLLIVQIHADAVGSVAVVRHVRPPSQCTAHLDFYTIAWRWTRQITRIPDKAA